MVREGRGRGWGGGRFLSLREAYISSLSLLRSLEPFEKFGVGGVETYFIDQP